MSQAARWAALSLLAVTGCARGCDAPPPPLPSPAPDASVGTAGGLHEVEDALKLHLVERKAGRDLLAGWHMLPWRRLRNWRPSEHLVVRLGAQGLIAGPASLGLPQATDPSQLTAFFAALLRAAPAPGVPSHDELVLAVDAQTSPDVMAALRAVILAVAPWRVVILARDGDQLVEVQLNPPQPGVRLPQVPTPTSAPHP